MKKLLLLILISCSPVLANSCYTNFPTTQNPVNSQSSGTCPFTWINGAATGLDWGNVSVTGGTPGQAHATVINGAPPYNDSTAVLSGSWATNQYASAVVAVNSSDASGQQEVELRLNTTVTAHSATGYEFDCSVKTSPIYCIIVRWNGALNDFTYCVNASTCTNVNSPTLISIPDGTVLAATNVGGLLTLYVNGVSEFTTTDHTYTGGSPGIGLWQTGGTTGDLANFGLKSFSASDGVGQIYPTATPSYSDVNVMMNGPVHTAVAGDTIEMPCVGTQSVTWASALMIPNNLTLTALGGTPNTGTGTFGSGTNCLTVRDNFTGGELIQAQIGYHAGEALIIQNFNIDPLTSGTALFSPLSINGTCTASGCPQMRLDNLGLGIGVQWTASGNGTNATWLIRSDNVFGVIDHVTEPTGSDAVFDDNELSAYLGVGGNGDNSWAQPDTFGTANALYMENNSIYATRSVSDCEEAPAGGGFGGCRQVGRYNQITELNAFGTFGLHGLDTGGRERAGRQLEVYGNAVTCAAAGTDCNIFAGNRGGTGFTFGNTMTLQGSTFWNAFFDIAVYRVGYSPSPWGACGGLNSLDPWDTNDNTVYVTSTATSGTTGLVLTDSSKTWTTNQWSTNGAPYSVWDVTFDARTSSPTGSFVGEIISNTSNTLTVQNPIVEAAWYNGGAGSFQSGDTYEIIRSTVCADQGGRGQGILLTGSSPSPSSPVNQALDPIYEWDDLSTPVRMNDNGGAQTGKLIANRDYYTDNWVTHGSGPFPQTSATSPFNGTTTCSGSYSCGVGFGTLANRPTTCTTTVGYFATDVGAQGTLYACKTTNTWTSIYAPYTYPHPLDGGTPQANAPTCVPGTESFFTSTGPILCSVTGGAPVICYSTTTTPATDGASGCTTGTLYTTTLSFSSTTTLNLVAGGTGFIDSPLTSYMYTKSVFGSVTPARYLNF